MTVFFRKLKVRPSFDARGRALIWIHAVSVGEVKAAKPFFELLRREYSEACFFVTTTTETGQGEAKRFLKEADAIDYLPFDLPWIVKGWVSRLKPKLFVLIESDFWPNLLREVQRSGGKTALVSGKMSEKSWRRFLRFLPFSKKQIGRAHV